MDWGSCAGTGAGSEGLGARGSTGAGMGAATGSGAGSCAGTGSDFVAAGVGAGAGAASAAGVDVGRSTALFGRRRNSRVSEDTLNKRWCW